MGTGPRELTTGVDVYGIGAILYELLTGRPPHVSGTPLGALVQVMLADPPRPRTVDRSVPRDLEVICLKCLAREPGSRYPSAVAVADDLDRWGRGEPILARPAGVAERARKWAKRRPALAGMTLAAMVGVAAGGVALWTQLRETSASLAETEQLRREEAAKAESARAALGDAQAAQAAQTVALSELAWRSGQLARAEELLDACPPGYRAWEWYYLKRLCRPPGVLVADHGEELTAPALAGGGRLVVAGGDDGVVRVWDTAAGREVAALRGHTGRVTGVTVGLLPEVGGRPAAERVVSGSQDGTIRVWDVETGACLRQRVAHSGGPVRSVTLSPDGILVATATTDRTVRVWAADTLAEQSTVSSPGASTSAIALGPPDPAIGGVRLAVGGDDGSIEVWDVTRRLRRTLSGHRAVVRSLAFSRDRVLARFRRRGQQDQGLGHPGRGGDGDPYRAPRGRPRGDVRPPTRSDWRRPAGTAASASGTAGTAGDSAYSGATPGGRPGSPSTRTGSGWYRPASMGKFGSGTPGSPRRSAASGPTRPSRSASP